MKFPTSTRSQRSPRGPNKGKNALSPTAKLALCRVKAAQAPDPAEVQRKHDEIERCRADCAYFIDTYCVIDDTQGHGDGSGVMPFNLWDAQRDVIKTLETEDLVVILKARQLGISWLCCAYVLWVAVFKPGQAILLFSQGETEANELLRRVLVLFERLPDWFKSSEGIPSLVSDNTSKLEWSNESRIRSMPATPRAGRSLTASVVVMDEAAHMMWGDKLYTAAKPTMDGGGQMIMLSTANGVGGLFHSIYTKAAALLNDFKTVFLPWWARPGRDQAWYDKKISEETDPARIKQEYPANATEAFLASGRVRFPGEWIDQQTPNIRKPITPCPIKVADLDHRSLSVYVLPVKGRQYVLAADVAEGLEHGDYSTAPVIDRLTGEEVATLHGHWEADTFAHHLAALGRHYNSCPIIVERNNHGHAVLATLRSNEVNYPSIGNGLDERAGWLSNVKTKPHSVDVLATALRDMTIIIHSQATLDEMQIYKVLKDGKTGAPEGYYDDRVMSWAIGLAFINMIPQAQAGAVGGPLPTLQAIPQMRLPQPMMGIPGSLA